MTTLLRLLPLSLFLAAPHLVGAQERAPEQPPEPTPRATDRAQPTPAAPVVPREMLPPAGKCRIWMEGVAPSQQPAPTDCQTALRQRPSNGTVVFGPSSKEPVVNAFGRRPSQVRRDVRRDSTARESQPRNSTRERPETRETRETRPQASPRTDTTVRRRRPEPQS